MKSHYYILFFIACLAHQQGIAQYKRLYTEAYFRPLVLPFGNRAMQDLGYGYHNFEYVNKPIQEYGINIGYQVYKGFSLGLGVSSKRLNHTIRYYENQLNNENLPNGNSYFNTINIPVWGLRFNTKYHVNKAYIEANIEINSPYNISGNTSLYKPQGNITFQTYLSSTGEQNTYSQQKEVFLDPSYFPYDYVIPEFVCGYELLKGLYLQGGIKYKWYGKSVQARIFYNGQAATYPNPTNDVQYLNDTRVYNRYTMFTFGVNYMLWWGRKN